MDKDDFTFCQIGTPTPVDQDLNEAQKITQNIGNIELNDELKNGVLQKDENTSNSTSKKEATFGSLSFTVTDKSTSKQSNEMPKPVPSQNGENAVKVLPGPSAVGRKPAPRAKVAFEKGYSPVDWLKLTRSHPDLAGLKGQTNRRLIPMAEVKLHRSEGSMWTVLKGRVYNLSPYMKFHPGGIYLILVFSL